VTAVVFQVIGCGMLPVNQMKYGRPVFIPIEANCAVAKAVPLHIFGVELLDIAHHARQPLAETVRGLSITRREVDEDQFSIRGRLAFRIASEAFHRHTGFRQWFGGGCRCDATQDNEKHSN
jgi:hypothetical protein